MAEDSIIQRVSVNQSVNCCALNELMHMVHRFLIDSMIHGYHKSNDNAEDYEDTGLQYIRIPAIFSVMHMSSKSCAIFFHGFWLSVKFWRIKLW